MLKLLRSKLLHCEGDITPFEDVGQFGMSGATELPVLRPVDIGLFGTMKAAVGGQGRENAVEPATVLFLATRRGWIDLLIDLASFEAAGF